MAIEFVRLYRTLRQEIGLRSETLDGALKSPWLWLILLGYLLRLAMMPVTGQHDVMFMLWQTHFINEGHLNLYGYLHEQFGDTVMSRPAVWAPYPYGFYAFTSLWLMLIEKIGLIDLANWALSWYVAHPARTVFLAKLAYLPFDILIGYPLFRSGGDRGQASWALWAWSSTAIYTPFMMGQNDIYATAFVTAGLYSAASSIRTSSRSSNRWSNSGKLLAVLLLGIGGTFKTFPLLFIPAVALLLTDQWTQRLGLMFLGCLPFVLVGLPFVTTPAFLNGVLLNPEGMQLFQESSWLGLPVSLFLTTYVSLLIYLSGSNHSVDPDRVWDVGLMLLALLFLFVRTPFYWLIWITPLIIKVTERRGTQLFIAWVVLQLGFSVLLLTKHRELGVALPIHLSEEFNLPNLPTALSLTHPSSQAVLTHLESLLNSAILAALGTALWRVATPSRKKRPSGLALYGLKVCPIVVAPVIVMVLGLALNVYAARNMVSPANWPRGKSHVSLSSEHSTLAQTFTPESTRASGVRLATLDSSKPTAHLLACLVKRDAGSEQQLACSSRSASQHVEDRVLYFLFDQMVKLEPDQPYALRLDLETPDATVNLPYAADRSGMHVQLGDTTLNGAIRVSMLRPFSIRNALRSLVLRNLGEDPCLLFLIVVTGGVCALSIPALSISKQPRK